MGRRPRRRRRGSDRSLPRAVDAQPPGHQGGRHRERPQGGSERDAADGRSLRVAPGILRRHRAGDDQPPRGTFYVFTLVPIRPRRRGGRDSLRTFLPGGVSLRPPLAFNPDTPRRLSTPLLTPFNSTPTFASYGQSPSARGGDVARRGGFGRAHAVRGGRRAAAGGARGEGGDAARGGWAHGAVSGGVREEDEPGRAGEGAVREDVSGAFVLLTHTGPHTTAFAR